MRPARGGRATRALVERRAPPAIPVDQRHEVAWHHGDAEPCLRPRDGAQARGELAPHPRRPAEGAREVGAPRPAPLRLAGEEASALVEAAPVSREVGEGLALVGFLGAEPRRTSGASWRSAAAPVIAARSPAEGSAATDEHPVALAVPDLDLGRGETVLPLAHALSERDVPSGFATARPLRSGEGNPCGAPVLAKPVTGASLGRMIGVLLHSGSRRT